MQLSGSVSRLSAMWVMFHTAIACSTKVPDEVRHASPESATEIRWDLNDGLSGVPWPNDALCWFDEPPSGPCRPNLPLVQQPPAIAQWLASINTTRGWPTTGPIVIPFVRSADANPGPAIDLSRFLSLQEDADPSNDAIYLLDIETGLPHPLAFPSTHGSHILQTPIALDLADKHRLEPSLVVETMNEQYEAVSQSLGTQDYSLERDVDSDGVIDVPALLAGHPCPTIPNNATEQDRSRVLRDRCLADALVDTYDPGNDTLRIYPRSPLLEGRRYAVLVTDRLLDNRGRPITGPFSSAVHPSQHTDLRRIVRWLSDSSRSDYYGAESDGIRGRVQFAWTFTTSTPSADLKQAFARSKQNWTESEPGKPGNTTSLAITHQFELDAPCPAGTPRGALSALLRDSLALTESEGLALDESLQSVSGIATGTFTYVSFPQQAEGPSASAQQGASVSVPVWLALPKAQATSALRLIIVTQGRETTHLEALRWAGQWASLGLATLSMSRRHEHALSAEQQRELEPRFSALCSTPMLEQLLAARGEHSNETWATDISPNVLQTRDLWRNEALELATVAGLLNNGVVRGTAPIATSIFEVAALVGIGTGAAPSAMAATLLDKPTSLVLIDPATSPDRAWRRGATWGAAQKHLWSVFGPRLSGIPATQLEDTRCTDKESSLRLVTADAPTAGSEIGCLPLHQETEMLFPKGGTVVATNLTTRARRCVGLSADGAFSLGLPAAAGDELSLEVFDVPNLLKRFGRDRDCDVPESASAPRFVFGGFSRESDTTQVVSVTVGGLGLERQSIEFRRALDLAAAAFSSANPASFVSALSQPTQPTDSKGLLLVVSPGDAVVPPDDGIGLAVAARLVPQLPADDLERFPALAPDVTPAELANALRKKTASARIDWARLQEGVPRLQRFPPDASTCTVNINTDTTLQELCRPTCLESSTCASGLQCINGRCDASVPTEAACSESLADVDALANEDSPFGAIRPVPYLRLARYAGELRADNLKEMWQPQFRILGPLVQPLHPDWPIIALSLPLAHPWGSHGILRDNLCHAFRFGNYVPYMIGHFIATNGTQYAPIFKRDTQQCLQAPRNAAGCEFVDLVD